MSTHLRRGDAILVITGAPSTPPRMCFLVRLALDSRSIARLTRYTSVARASLRALFVVMILCAMSSALDDPLQLTVIDAAGAPLAGATVSLMLANKPAAAAQTDQHGRVSFPSLAAGSYTVEVSKRGYLKTQTTVAIEGSTALPQIEIVLTKMELSEQRVEVNAQAENPIAEESSSTQTLQTVQAKDMPTRPATFTQALPLLPGVTTALDGSLTIAGLGENHSALLVNSVNVTDPGTGDFGLSIPIDSVDRVSVAEAPYLAQYGRFTAGVVSADTRRGGDHWQFSLNDPLPEFRIRSGAVQGLRSATPRFNVGGPVIPGRVYLVEGAEYLLNKQAVRTLPFPRNETQAEAVNSFTQIDTIISPAQSLTVSGHVAPHSVKYAGLSFFNPQPVTPSASFHEGTGAAIHRWSIGGGLLQSTLAFRRVSSSVQPQGQGEMALAPAGNTGNYFSSHLREASRYEWAESWMPKSLHFLGTHNLRLGGEASRSFSFDRFQARPVEIHDAAGNLLQRIEFTSGRAIRLSDTQPEFYAQDHWLFNDHVALDFGLRAEDQSITHTIRLAPRGGFAWTPGDKSRTVVRGGVGIFYDSVPLNVYKFRSYPSAIVTTFDVAGNVVEGPDRYFNITQMSGRRFPFIRRSKVIGNFAPYSISGNVEAERSFGSFLLFRIKYLRSHADDLITMHNDALRSGRKALVLDSAGEAQTRQIEFTTRIGNKADRQFFFSYVRQQARGNVNEAKGYLGDLAFPVVRQNVFASLPGEVPNRFLLWGIYALPRGFQVAPHVELRNGLPFQPLNVLQQYASLPPGPQLRFPRYFSVDTVVAKDIKINAKHAVRLSTSFLNITNHFNPLDVHANLADQQYGTFFGNNHRRVLLDFDFLY